jgi:hypothetical protein
VPFSRSTQRERISWDSSLPIITRLIRQLHQRALRKRIGCSSQHLRFVNASSHFSEDPRGRLLGVTMIALFNGIQTSCTPLVKSIYLNFIGYARTDTGLGVDKVSSNRGSLSFIASSIAGATLYGENGDSAKKATPNSGEPARPGIAHGGASTHEIGSIRFFLLQKMAGKLEPVTQRTG